MAIFTENVLLIMTLTKITMCWINRQSLRRLLIEVQDNFIVDNYNTFEKRFILMKYTKLAKYYFFIAVPTMTIAAAFYYIQELIPNVKMAMSNSSLSYKLPYKTRTIMDIRDVRIYICLCIYQFLVPPTIVLGFVGFDCLFTNLAFHITAQFGILSCTVGEVLDDSNGFKRNIRKLVFQHYKLIRQAETLEDNFNVIILQQLMGTTLQLCISGYNTLLSSNLSNAFYRYEWYNVSPTNLKMVNICMLRMKKPQQLTSGKFFVLSLASFTDFAIQENDLHTNMAERDPQNASKESYLFHKHQH
uniref:uncharacterized protein LOC127072289 n=1 Tax=Vespula vulgaris TaxID=7454 RepID=UPI00223AEE24|nr:uncharacterized protein LOC127072289 [Vespula vulgaris]